MGIRAVAIVLSLSAPAAAQTEERHTVRPRLGVSTSGGALIASAQGPNASVLPGEAWGLDVRAGVQLGDIVALYVQPSMVVGTVNNACFAMTESVLALWAPVLVDFTFSDRVSLAVGAGPAAVPDQPLGWTVHLRAATYFYVYRVQKTRMRHALSLALETRAYSLNASGAPYFGGIFMLALGYEWY